MSDRTCTVCSKPLTSKRPDTLYCSASCTNKAWRARTANDRIPAVTACECCGGPMDGKRWQARYCSKNCASLHHYRRGRDGAVRADRECPLCSSVIPGSAHGNRVFCSIRCAAAASRISAYGMTVADYNDLLVAQGYACAICGGAEQWKPDDRGFHIDHDHQTGKVRGILCPACNLMLGYAKDAPDVLTRAAEYLRGQLA